jgi:4-hydroxy-tetrahydrodipicolinate synthase
MSIDEQSLRDGLGDVGAAVLTPFDENGDIQYDSLGLNAQFLSDRGIGLVLACANVSEFHSLTTQEKISVVETTVDELPNETTVLASAGGSLRTAIRLAEEHARSGADALMVMPPDNTFIHEQGLIEYYDELGNQAELPLVPYIRGIEPRPETIAAIADLPHVAGMKYAIDDIETFSWAVEQASDETVWLCGMGEPPVPAYWVEGAEGFTSGAGNIVPRIGLALRDALQNGEWAEAIKIRNATLPFQKLRSETGQHNQFQAANSVPVLKQALTRVGADGGHVRRPLVELEPEDRQRVNEEVDRLEEFVQNETSLSSNSP